MNKTFVFDIDGTIITNEHLDETKKNIKAIKKLKQKGYTIILSTGRSYRSMIKLYKELNLDEPMILNDGSLSIWKEDEEYKEISINPLDVTTMKTFFNENKENIRGMFLEDLNLINVLKDFVHLKNHITDKQDIEITLSTASASALRGYIVSEKNKGEELINNLQKLENLEFKILGDYEFKIIDVTSNKTNKGIALKKVKERLNIKNDIILFCDNINDIPMFEEVDEVVAVWLAVEEVKDKASKVLDIPLYKYLNEF